MEIKKINALIRHLIEKYENSWVIEINDKIEKLRINLKKVKIKIIKLVSNAKINGNLEKYINLEIGLMSKTKKN